MALQLADISPKQIHRCLLPLQPLVSDQICGWKRAMGWDWELKDVTVAAPEAALDSLGLGTLPMWQNRDWPVAGSASGTVTLQHCWWPVPWEPQPGGSSCLAPIFPFCNILTLPWKCLEQLSWPSAYLSVLLFALGLLPAASQQDCKKLPSKLCLFKGFLTHRPQSHILGIHLHSTLAMATVPNWRASQVGFINHLVNLPLSCSQPHSVHVCVCIYTVREYKTNWVILQHLDPPNSFPGLMFHNLILSTKNHPDWPWGKIWASLEGKKRNPRAAAEPLLCRMVEKAVEFDPSLTKVLILIIQESGAWTHYLFLCVFIFDSFLPIHY